MQNFQDTFETREWSFIITFSICMTLPSKTGFLLSSNSHGYKTTFYEAGDFI